MNGGYACRTMEETMGAGPHVDLCGSPDAAGAESTPPPSSGRSEAATRAYADPYADTLEVHASFGSTHPDWCVDVGSGLVSMTTFELWEALERGQVLAWMRVWREGMECWTPVGEIAEFTWAIAGTPAPPSDPEAGLSPTPPPLPADTPLAAGDLARSTEAATAFGLALGRPSALWVPVGAAVALIAVAAALVVTHAPPQSGPAESAAGVAETAPLPEASLPADEGPELQATMHQPERGQCRLPRGGRRAYRR
jgi:hypothetical protein